MKKITVIALALSSTFIGLASHAENKMIDCTDVGNQMSWHVTIKSDLTVASHSDNDHEVALKKQVSRSPTLAPHELKLHLQDKMAKIKFYSFTLKRPLKAL